MMEKSGMYYSPSNEEDREDTQKQTYEHVVEEGNEGVEGGVYEGDREDVYEEGNNTYEDTHTHNDAYVNEEEGVHTDNSNTYNNNNNTQTYIDEQQQQDKHNDTYAHQHAYQQHEYTHEHTYNDQYQHPDVYQDDTQREQDGHMYVEERENNTEAYTHIQEGQDTHDDYNYTEENTAYTNTDVHTYDNNDTNHHEYQENNTQTDNDTQDVAMSDHKQSEYEDVEGKGGEEVCEKIFVGGLGRNTTEKSLKTYFEQFGEVAEAHIILDKTTQRSRGFGFVTFKHQTPLSALKAVKHFVDSVKVDVRTAVPREEAKEAITEPADTPGRVFVGGLNDDVTEQKFKEFFQQFGELKSSNLMYDKDSHKPRGFGFVIYENPDDADKCLGTHESLGRNCEAKKALPRPVYSRVRPSFSPPPYQHFQRIVNPPTRYTQPHMNTYRDPYDHMEPPYYGYGPPPPHSYSPVDPAYNQYNPYYDSNAYPPQQMANYYPPPSGQMSQQYQFGPPPPLNHPVRYTQSMRGDVYTQDYTADRSRRNALRSFPY